MLAILLSAVFSFNALAQSDSAERLDVKNLTVNDKPKEAEKENPIEKAVNALEDIAQSGSYAFTTTTTGSLTDMSTGTTTLVAANTDDTASSLTNIGFDFYFMGARYTQFSVNENGVLRLGASAQTGSPYQPLAQAGIPIITAYGADQRTHTTGSVRFKVIGAAPNRTLVVEWFNTQSNFSSGGTADLTYQVRLTETSGVIEFVYGSMTMSAAGAADANSNDPQIGFSSTNTANNVGSVTAPQSGTPAPTFNGTSAVPTNNLYVAGSIAVLSSATQGARRTFTFTPPIPTAPTSITFTAVTPASYTLNWADAPDEDLYAIYRSTDNVNFTFIGTAAENATSFNATGLSPSTNYFWRVFSVSEGALSATSLDGSQVTNAPANVSCNGAGGNWGTGASWSGGLVPTAGDNVTIQSGCTMTINVAAVAFNVTVQSGGILIYEATTARTLTVTQSVTIDNGGTFQTAATGTVVTHVLSVGTDLTNNGTLDFSTNANTAGAGITFTGAASNTFGGTGATTDIRAITINKGTSNANILEVTLSNLTVRSLSVDPTNGFLTLTNGTFKISGTFTLSSRTFTANYTIPATAGIWLNNPNYTVTGINGSPTNNGLFRLTQGTYTVGTATGNSMDGGTGSVFIIEGGTLNCTGRFSPQGSVTYTQTGGTINVTTIGQSSSSFGSFEIFGSSSVVNMSGGTINIVQPSTAATPWDLNIRGTMNYSGAGTTVNLGTSATITNFNYRVQANVPNLVINNQTNNKTATFIAQTIIYGNVLVNTGTTYNHNGFLVALLGANATPTFTNNGNVVGSTAGSTMYFGNGATPITYTGTGVSGTNALPIQTVSIDSASSVIFDPALTNNVITNRINLFSGSVTGSNKLTLGTGAAGGNTIQIGNNTTGTPAGTFDVPLTFNLGSGGETILYLRTTASRTTGNEVNPTRTLTALTYDDNVAGRTLTVAGGNLTVSGALTLTNGVIVTDNANTLIHNGTATRTAGFVDGPLRRDFAVAVGTTYTFHVGEGVYSPVALANIVVAPPAELTVEAVNATLTPFNPATSISRNWGLTKTGAGTLTADVSFTYDQTDDVNGNEADYRLFRRDSGAPVEVCGTGCVDETTNVATITGLSSFSRWTIAEAFVPTAASVNIGGRVLTADGLTGLPKARVTISGNTLQQPITVTTSPFGYYSFADLPVGTYVLTVDAKQYTFNVPTRVVTAEDNITGVDFIANQ
jgi:Carboxypeptidase regulatory-like domain/Fibronectin type III domain/G8 domain